MAVTITPIIAETKDIRSKPPGWSNAHLSAFLTSSAQMRGFLYWFISAPPFPYAIITLEGGDYRVLFPQSHWII